MTLSIALQFHTSHLSQSFSLPSLDKNLLFASQYTCTHVLASCRGEERKQCISLREASRWGPRPSKSHFDSQKADRLEWASQTPIFLCSTFRGHLGAHLSHTRHTPRLVRVQAPPAPQLVLSASLSFQTFVRFSPPHTDSVWPQVSSGTPIFQTPEASSSTPVGPLWIPRQASTTGDRSWRRNTLPATPQADSSERHLKR